jgi:glycosyltransferase involved in cell wall biosynthesis
MRVGIDAHHLNGKPQGSRTYLIQLIRALVELADDDFVIYSFRPEETRLLLTSARLDHRRVFPESARLRLPFVVPALGLRDRLDVFHSQYLAPPFSFVPDVVTIHDVLFETHPELFRGAFSRRSVALIRRSARRAQVVVTVSEFSRQAILERYRLPEDRVVVTPNAVDREAFRPDGSGRSPVRERYGLKHPYVLSVGRIEPRKNLTRLFRSFERVRKRLGKELVLAVAGASDFHSRAIEAEARDDSILLLGAVPDEDLPSLYREAEALAYPSLAEGFGMPVLEAMACGAPVLTTRRGALPEVGGEAVLFVEPEDQESIEAGLERILTDTALRERLRKAGPARAEAFSWRETARLTLSAYRRAAGKIG